MTTPLTIRIARTQDARALAGVVGEDEISETDKKYLAFGRAFEEHFIAQGIEENREIGQSLDMGWYLISMLPAAELTRVTMEELRAHVGGDGPK